MVGQVCPSLLVEINTLETFPPLALLINSDLWQTNVEVQPNLAAFRDDFPLSREHIAPKT